MAVFGPLQLTTNGQALYTKAQTGTTLTFTRMQIGGGQLASNQDPTTLTALISPISYFNINSELTNGSTAIIRGIFENTNLTSSTYVCEIGLFAQDPTAGEILYAYANAGTQGDTLPPISDGPISRQFNLNITVGNATNVTVNIPANTYIPVNQMGVANGVPSLDNTGKIPVAQIPSLSYIPTSAEGAPNGVPTLDSNGKVPSNQLYDLTQQTNNFTKTQQFTAATSSIEANQIILGTASNISSPTSPIVLASPNAQGIGLDQYGNILPIAPGSIPSGKAWNILDKTGNKILSGYLDGSKKLSSVNNTLDDGNGNVTIKGNNLNVNPNSGDPAVQINGKSVLGLYSELDPNSLYLNALLSGGSNGVPYSAAAAYSNGVYVKGNLAIEGKNAVAIDSSGSNANGYYIRFTNGLQICWNTGQWWNASQGWILTAQTGVNYYYISGQWTFPASFVANGVLSLTASGDIGGVMGVENHNLFNQDNTMSNWEHGALTNTSPAGYAYNTNYSHLAIGYWK